MVNNPDWDAFERWLDKIMARDHVPGVGVGVSQRGRVIYAKGFGTSDLSTGRPVDENTVFGIASVSKSFAALSLMQLSDEGKVNPYAPLVRYLPEFRMKDVPDREAIRIHHCLSHTTGCPPLFRAQGKFSEFSEHIQYLADYDTTVLGKPGEYISYCNDTFMLNGAVVERVTGQRYRDFVMDRIIRPLGMSRTTFDLDELATWDNVTNLYNLSPNKTSVEWHPWIDLGTYHVGGGIRSTVLDLLRYGDMYCAEGRTANGTRVVSEAGVLRMRAPVYPCGEGRYYCYAQWITPAHHGVTVVEHSGGQPGVSARWGYIPEEGISIAVLTNLRGAPADQVFIAAVNTVLGLSPEVLRTKPSPTFPVDSEQMRLLAGVYQADEGMSQLEAKQQEGTTGRVIRIFLEDDKLVGEFDGEVHRLRMVAPTEAVYVEQGIDRPIRWYLRDGRPAWAISTGLQMTKRAPNN